MRPNKHINSWAHRSKGTPAGKSRHFTSATPEATEEEEPRPQLELPASVERRREQQQATKYDGRASVRPSPEDGTDVTIDLKHEEWVDPLDSGETIDLATVTIDLRAGMRQDPPEGYYQRFSSKVPGHE